MCKPVRPFDVKMLVLKRWNQAQTGRLFEESAGQRGQYISFQSHHFIDILSSEESTELFNAYEQLRGGNAPCAGYPEMAANEVHFRDIHTVQSMALLGEGGGFWDTATDVMHITFIQLSDSTRWEYDEVKKQLSDKISANKQTDDAWDQAEWALYYSLDFCDLVLFTKHVKLKPLNDLLWEMALLRCNEFQTIRDTFTTSCFEYNFLKGFFEREEKGLMQDASRVWDDQLALSMNFSVRDMSVLPKLTHSISTITKQFQSSRLSGRYDFRITTDSLQGDQVLKILYQINALFKDQNGNPVQPFNGYEVVPLAAPWDRDYPKEGTFPDSGMFENRIKLILDKLHNSCIKSKQPFTEYISETLRSLYELTNSGFSEEFVLCVLPSLSAFIEIMGQAADFQEEAETESEQEKIKDSLLHLRKSYFTALNTLSLCTMHSERQFIHAPAFNAVYFEIPPKMLAFYNAITDHIASLLAEDEGKKYYFSITPDYRSDIYVKPLNIHYKKDTTKHLAIINLPEKYFYQPEKAIMLLAHEVGHYVGERNRKERAESIFEMVGLLLLQYTPLRIHNHTVRLFAKEFGSYLNDQYQSNLRVPVRGIKAPLDDVARFLTDIHQGLDYFTVSEYLQTIALRWSKALYEKRDDATIRKECRALLKGLDKSLHTRYFDALVDKTAFAGACDVIARSTACKLSSLRQPDKRNDYQDIADTSEAIVQAFSEAFADKQMLSVVGSQFKPQDYVDILKEVQQDADSSGYSPTTEQLLRYNAVKCIERSLPDDCFTLQDSFQKAVVESIAAYLSSVENSWSKKTGDWCEHWEEEYFGARDWAKRCEIICSVLTKYKERLCSEMNG